MKTSGWPPRGFYHHYSAASGRTQLIHVLSWMRCLKDWYGSEFYEYIALTDGLEDNPNTCLEDFHYNPLNCPAQIAEQGEWRWNEETGVLYGMGTMVEEDHLKLFLSTEGTLDNYPDNIEQGV